MKNRRPPTEMQRYVVILHRRTKEFVTREFKYFHTIKEAKAWAKDKEGVKSIFKMTYDFLYDLE